MAEDVTEAPEPEPDESYSEQESGRVASIAEQLGAVKDEILAAVKDMIGSGPARERDDDNDGSDIAAQVKKAVRDLAKAERKRGQEETAKKEEPVPEKPPQEFRKITTRLWGEP